MIAAEIRLWGKRVAAISINDDSPYVSFRYDKAFIQSGIEISPIVMPLSDTIYEFKTLPLETFKGLPGLVADSIPDKYGNQIIDAWLLSQGRSLQSFNIIERLCTIGSRGMGALEFHPLKHRDLSEESKLELNELVKLSNQIINKKQAMKRSLKDNMQDIIKVGTSAGGARAKAIIAYNEKEGIIKSGQMDAGPGFTYWLLKLDGIDQISGASFTKREYAYYLMALDAKIIMSESRLLEKDGFSHFMTKRFDRLIINQKMEKRHMQTLGSLVHVDYNQPRIYGYENAVLTMKKLKLKQEDFKQFYRRMIFNIMARNQDDHVKNISFLMDQTGSWSLSPAYDVTFSYNPKGLWTSSHQMTINGKFKDLTLDDLYSAAKNMFVTLEEAKTIINEVKMALLKWESFAKKAKLSHQEIDVIKQHFITFDS